MNRKKISLNNIEKLLIPRLHFIGVVLVVISMVTLFYVLFADHEHDYAGNASLPAAQIENSSIEASHELPFFTVTEDDCSRCYAISAVFTVLGLALILIAKQKKNKVDKPGKEKK
ncbi:MAG: hypothetical protein HKM07_04885 [Chlamydiae bacterium]|nr:hypothetical protein [Chlamydiota bacterium]